MLLEDQINGFDLPDYYPGYGWDLDRAISGLKAHAHKVPALIGAEFDIPQLVVVSPTFMGILTQLKRFGRLIKDLDDLEDAEQTVDKIQLPLALYLAIGVQLHDEKWRSKGVLCLTLTEGIALVKNFPELVPVGQNLVFPTSGGSFGYPVGLTRESEGQFRFICGNLLQQAGEWVPTCAGRFGKWVPDGFWWMRPG